MKRRRYAEEQIISTLNEQETDAKAVDLGCIARCHQALGPPLDSKYSGMTAPGLKLRAWQQTAKALTGAALSLATVSVRNNGPEQGGEASRQALRPDWVLAHRQEKPK